VASVLPRITGAKLRMGESSTRTDAYGGPIENRARFLLEVTQAAISVWGADRVGVRIAPSGTYGSMSDSNPPATFGYVTTQLDRLGIAYLHVIEPRIKGIEEIVKGQAPIAAQHLRPKFSRALIAAGGFTPDTAAAIVAAGDADLVAFGRYFISNPDLPSDSGWARRSAPTIARPSMAAMPAATPTTRPSTWRR
jgi:N-ethylmaleimide reductase